MAARIFLGLMALLFVGYGLVCLASPGVPAEAAGLEMLSGDGAAEMRAMYGGLQTAVGMLALAAVLREELQRPVLFFLAFVLFGLASGRMVGAIADSAAGLTSYTWGALVFEAVSFGVAMALLGRSASAGDGAGAAAG